MKINAQKVLLWFSLSVSVKNWKFTTKLSKACGKNSYKSEHMLIRRLMKSMIPPSLDIPNFLLEWLPCSGMLRKHSVLRVLAAWPSFLVSASQPTHGFPKLWVTFSPAHLLLLAWPASVLRKSITKNVSLFQKKGTGSQSSKRHPVLVLFTLLSCDSGWQCRRLCSTPIWSMKPSTASLHSAFLSVTTTCLF